MTFASSLALSEEGRVAKAHGGTSWIGSRASCSAEAATENKLETHTSRQEHPLPCSSFTPLSPFGGTDVPSSQYTGRVHHPANKL
jgi:hypothetical protein